MRKEVAVHWGRRIADRRAKLGLSQDQLADAVEREQQTISRIERGEAVPRVELMDAIASALGTKPWLLYTWPGQPGERARVSALAGAH